MGEVYRARDTKLDREVAIKILPEIFVSDPDRVARFTREARTLAALNHPNIAAIHGLEESKGLSPLVLELVEGPTLADRISQGPIPLEEALPIARQIVDALEAAHEQGIVHRDLKPANIKVRPDGTVKVLDFGLAKALSVEGSGTASALVTNSPTLTSPVAMTVVGVLLGTAAYMAPEQARGKPVDRRADIWAFGCVLYEMLTGRQAFGAESVSDTLANVLKADLDWNALPHGTPENVRDVIARCLIKDSNARIPHISVARYLLTDLASTTRDKSLSQGPRLGAQAVRGAAVAALVVMTSLVTWWATRPAPELVKATRFTVAPPGSRPLGVPPFRSIAITPDGTRLVYLTQEGPIGGEIFIRSLDQLDSVPLPGLRNPQGVFVSPDSNWIGFMSGGGGEQLMKVPISGGPPNVGGDCGLIFDARRTRLLTHRAAGLLIGVHAHAEYPGRLPNRQVRGSGELGRCEPDRSASKVSALAAGAHQTRLRLFY